MGGSTPLPLQQSLEGPTFHVSRKETPARTARLPFTSNIPKFVSCSQ